MGFTIEELFHEILNSALEEEDKVTLLSRLYKKGQLQNEVFLVKREGEDTFEVCKRQINPENGRTEVIDTNYTAEQAVNSYAASVIKAQSK